MYVRALPGVKAPSSTCSYEQEQLGSSPASVLVSLEIHRSIATQVSIGFNNSGHPFKEKDTFHT
eukprot:1536543-Amphidinium_carterae.1